MFPSIFHENVNINEENLNKNSSSDSTPKKVNEAPEFKTEVSSRTHRKKGSSVASHFLDSFQATGEFEVKTLNSSAETFTQNEQNTNAANYLCTGSGTKQEFSMSKPCYGSPVKTKLLKESFEDSSQHVPGFQNFRANREEIDRICNICVLDILEERERRLQEERKKSSFQSGNKIIHSDIYSKREENLNQQLKEFEKFVSSTKAQFTLNNYDENNCTYSETTIKTLYKEAAIFQQYFPIYGLRQQVLNEIKKNKVTIISADCIYLLNIALPLILSSVYQNHSIISCEENEVLSQILQEKINSVLSTVDQTLVNLRVLSEEQLLCLLSYTTSFAETNSCIVFNVSLKRSLISDIVLSDLRDLLVLQKNSKLILLTSPYDNISKFKTYFSSNVAVSVLNLPRLYLPVKTVWKDAMSSPKDDCKDDIVQTIFSIHAVCEPGDIVAFLPSVEDAQSIYEELDVKILHYQYNEIKIFCIDDKFSDCCLKANVNLSSERKVFLLTNGYEGLIIPSARYVIDCGIQKEYAFDSETDSNILVSTFISQARAKIRKHVVGRYDSGICFRIYNKANYMKNMQPREHAELFNISPIHSMVKVFHHRPYKSETIQFVESLPHDVQINTLKLLKTYGAVDKDSHLTSFGEKIVKLNLPIKYARLIMFGIQWGFAYEAIVLVAFFSTRMRLFAELTDEEHKILIDFKKMNFNQLDSDTLTYLNIFKMWKENGFRKLWCNEHYINFATLKSIRSKVSELCDLTHKCIEIVINQEFSESTDQTFLIQMLLECFHDNLCSYTGHRRTGYRILSTKQFALVHPLSFLSQKEDFPRFVIYESLDSNYIINLTCIPFDSVMEYLHNGILNFTGADLFEDQLVERVIDSVGEKFISQILLKNDGQKAREIEGNIKKETGVKVVLLEAVVGKGCVNVYAFPNDIDKCIVSVKNILKGYVEAFLKEEELKVIELKKGQNKVMFEIKWTKGAETISFEQMHNFQLISQQNLSSAVEATSESTQTSINYSLQLFWPRRFCSGEGYLNLKNQNVFHRARTLTLRYIPVAEYEVFVQISNIRGNQLLLSEIPPEVTEEELVKSFANYLPKGEFEIELCYLAPFETSYSELQDMKKQIEENCRNETNLNNFEVKISMPDPSAKCMRAYINVFETRCLDIEAINLASTKVNNMKLKCKPLYFSNLMCSVPIYNALQYRIKEELEIFNHERIKKLEKSYSFKINTSSEDSVSIILSSDDTEIIKLLQLVTNDLLHGIKLNENNIRNIHKLFCHGGHVFLKTLERTENVLITQNFETKSLRLYGLEKNCNYVRQYICLFLQDTENEIVKDIILSKEKQNRLILKALIMQYGANLEKFIELCGLRSAALDIRTSCLSLYGMKESIEKAEEFIKELSTTTDSGDSIYSDSSSQEMCPICFCPAENLTFRLEHCGHLYCSRCITALVKQGHFPIQCCAENCSKDIILEDIKYLLNHDVEEINELADKSLKAYLTEHIDKVYYCPAPDCSMFVFKNLLTEDKWSCPLCKNSICIKCNVAFHEGYTCDMYQGSKEDPDYSFKVWSQKNGTKCKHCPFCKVPIEKRDGCNHMTCLNCNGHFCWICSESFPTGNDVYNHIGRVHPGMLFAH